MKTTSARMRTGMCAGLTAMTVNLLLACAKIAAGAFTGLVSLIADGVNNLSDCGSGAVSLISFRVAARPADSEHPFGHRRAEYIASFAISFLILFFGAELLIGSVRTAVGGKFSMPDVWTYAVLCVSIAVKAGMGGAFLVISKKIGSDVLRATAIDSFCDLFASLAVLAGAAIGQTTGFPADGYAGALVALFIVWEGIRLARDAGSKLLGRAPDPALLSAIRAELLSEERVLGVHDLKVYPYGPDVCFATVHVEMDANVPAMRSHEVIDGLERRVGEKFGVPLTAHLDPVDRTDAQAVELEERVRAAAEGMVEGLDLHDFRLIRGEKPRLVFEAGVPFDCKKKDAEIAGDLARIVKILGDYEVSVTVERE